MINVRMKRRFDVKGSTFVQQAVKQVEKELGSEGRVVLRASGTEPVIRVMVEGRDSDQVARLSRHLADTVQRAADQAA
jgi:phosphoglucosamine mutase